MFWIIQWAKSYGDNFGTVDFDKSIYRGSAPNRDDFKKLNKLGVSMILDLRDGDQSKAREAAAGFAWRQVPMSDTERPEQVTVDRALEFVRRGNVYLHCIGGRHRTSLIVACYKVRDCGWSKKQAWAEAKKFGFYGALGHQPLEDFFFQEFNR